MPAVDKSSTDGPFTRLQVRLLKRLFPGGPYLGEGCSEQGRSKVASASGGSSLGSLSGKTVIDFGCGVGREAIEIAQSGAQRVIGLDYREQVLEEARIKAASAGLSDVCVFASKTAEQADVLVSFDAFEHFDDPAAILRAMDGLLRPDGYAFVTFGPTWYHPLGGHCFSPFPWAHLLFSESALVRWRSDVTGENIAKFRDIDGGLNQISISAFEKFVEKSPFRVASFEAVPIRHFERLHNGITREFFTAIVRCRLVKRNG